MEAPQPLTVEQLLERQKLVNRLLLATWFTNKQLQNHSQDTSALSILP
jgi:hypothetical protein